MLEAYRQIHPLILPPRHAYFHVLELLNLVVIADLHKCSNKWHITLCTQLHRCIPLTHTAVKYQRSRLYTLHVQVNSTQTPGPTPPSLTAANHTVAILPNSHSNRHPTSSFAHPQADKAIFNDIETLARLCTLSALFCCRSRHTCHQLMQARSFTGRIVRESESDHLSGASPKD